MRKCNVCGVRRGFSSIEKEIGQQLADNDFPYLLSDFETLNYKRYACKNCGAADRERLYKLYLDKKLPEDRLSLIDFAPAYPLQACIKAKPNVIYRSADLYMDEVDDKVDITNMNIYEDNQFDFFICSHVLEHVDDQRALKELHRILKPGCKGILMTPVIDRDNVFDEDMTTTDAAERWHRFAQDDHVRLYSKKVFLERVAAAGFGVEQLGWRQLGLMSFIRYAIALKSVLYVVSK